MADFNIDGNLHFTPHSAFSIGTTAITFHAARACTVIFTPIPNCFGIATQPLPAGGAPTSLPVTQKISTNLTIVGNDAGAPAQPADASTGTTYDITFSSAT